MGGRGEVHEGEKEREKKRKKNKERGGTCEGGGAKGIDRGRVREQEREFTRAGPE